MVELVVFAIIGFGMVYLSYRWGEVVGFSRGMDEAYRFWQGLTEDK